jgi:hypothetical protein
MQLTEDNIKKFQQAYKKDFNGEEISRANPEELMGRTISLYLLLMKPLPAEKKSTDDQKLAAQHEEVG